MHLSTVLLIGLFLLCCTHNLDAFARRIPFRTGRAVALFALLLMISSFDFELSAGVSLHPASLLLLMLALVPAGREKESYSLLLAAFGAGVLGWLLTRAFPEAPEAGALMALPAAVLARVLYRTPRTGLGMVLLSPLMYELCAMLEDWYLFGFASISLGDGLQFDAQMAGMLLYGALLLLPDPTRRQSFAKDAGPAR